ncbi:MAG: serine/threonine protein kinase [Planctomycetes bacterium]|nr:serine/threonine protein kinase [Planctomycetota bacterium]
MESFDPRYRILEEVGQGGMSTVYRARDLRRGTEVAVKRLHPHLAGTGLELHLFHREYSILSRLDVEGVPRVGEAGEWDGAPWFAMDLVEGRPLPDHALIEGQGREDEIWLIARASVVLSRVHGAGIVHRDLKPENVLVGRDGKVWLVDFGVAAFAGSPPHQDEEFFVIGTPAYLAPERTTARAVCADPRSDVWSLGVVLYDVLAGRAPYEADSGTEILRRVGRENPPPLDEVAPVPVPPALAGVAMRALSRRPEDRFATAGDFARALFAALGAYAPEPRPAAAAA